MTQRTFTLLRAVLLINASLLMVGLLRVGVVSWESRLVSDRRDLSRRDLRFDLHGPCPGNCSCHLGASRSKADVRPISEEVPQVRRLGDDINNETEFQVPNIVHYIWFNTAPRPLQFHHMVSVLSAHKILEPDVVYFHTNMEPTGPYWEVVKALPKLKVMSRDPPVTLFGEAVKEPFYYTSHSNVDRVKILMEYGGIYLDFDVIVTRPFDDLRRHVCNIGLEQPTQACGSVIVCSKTSFFLSLWINAYLDDYRIEEWAYNTGKVPYKLARRFPHLVNVEKTRINRPNFKELDKIWGPNTFDWEQNYAVHVWYRLWKDTSPYFHGIEPDPENIKTWNSTFGEMARSVLYGTRNKIERDQIDY